MFDHCSFAVNEKDYEKSLAFYDATLEILGHKRTITIDMPEYKVKTAGYGDGIRPKLWIGANDSSQESVGNARGVHFAFIATSVEMVNDWYSKCIEMGATDNGEPGPRAHYHAGYYGAFVIDPNGWRIEACFHEYKG